MEVSDFLSMWWVFWILFFLSVAFGKQTVNFVNEKFPKLHGREKLESIADILWAAFFALAAISTFFDVLLWLGLIRLV